MKAPVPQLTPFLRSDAQGEILALLFTHVDKEFSIAEITRRVGSLPATVHREVERLITSGTFLDRYEGRSRMIRVNTEHQMYKPLSEIVLLGYGPKPVLEQSFMQLNEIQEAYIFGSWAARYRGEPGLMPHDIDVVVIGTTLQSELQRIAKNAEKILRREVNVVRVSEDDWAAGLKPFIRTIQSRPLVKLNIHGTQGT